MTLYTTNPRFDSTCWTFEVCLGTQLLFGFGWSWEPKSKHFALHLGPFTVTLWRVTL